MVQVKDLTQLTVADLWKEVKDEEAWWHDISAHALRVVQTLLEETLEAELVEQLWAGRYKRTEVRQGYRNGVYYRSLSTPVGLIPHLRVPRARESAYQPQVLARYQRRTEEVNARIRDLFLAGVATRRVGEVLEPLLGDRPSATTVSRVCAALDREVAAFLRRPLCDAYCYLLLDGITLKVRTGVGAKRRLVLCAYGITPAGQRELISFRQATAESEAQWEAFLRDLYARGLEGQGLRLISTDGCPGLHRALDTVYPYVPRQRCWAHKLRNLAAKLPRAHQETCLREAKGIYLAQTRREALARFWTWAARWREVAPKAVACLQDDLEELLAFLNCPPAHWRTIRTTNAIERAFREVRRRTRPMSCFQNRASVDRIIYGVLSYLNKKWRDKPLRQFTQNS